MLFIHAPISLSGPNMEKIKLLFAAIHKKNAKCGFFVVSIGRKAEKLKIWVFHRSSRWKMRKIGFSAGQMGGEPEKLGFPHVKLKTRVFRRPDRLKTKKLGFPRFQSVENIHMWVY